MSQEYIELRGSSAIELRSVDGVIRELARPALGVDTMSPWTRAALVQLGICVAGNASRKDLIERLWNRKRALLSKMSALGESGPLGPVA
jgi:hypothetical protein